MLPLYPKRDGEDVAYCVLRPERLSDHEVRMHITDWAVTNKGALYSLMGFLYKLAAQAETFRIGIPDDFELSALIDEPYDIRFARNPRVMARVLDVPGALRLMRHPAGAGTYTLRVRDDFLPENDGDYRVAYGPGGVTVEKGTQGAPDMILTVQTFAQLCLGYLAFDMAALKRDVTVAGNEDTLRTIFVKKPKYHTDRY